MLARPLSTAELRAKFEEVLAAVRSGAARGVPTGVGFDAETDAALWAVVGDPSSDLLVQRARDELEAQVSGAHARAREAAWEAAKQAAVRPSARRSPRGA